MKVHMIGMCGLGMSSVAILLKEGGNVVTGSDAECYGPPKETLADAGLHPLMPYDPKNIPGDTDEFVVGRNAKLVREENAEVDAAYRSGKPVRSFPEVLGRLTQGRRNVVVAGSYGKSTTTTILVHLLRYAGVDTGYFIGAEPVKTHILSAPAHIGTDPTFVLEGDEYPSGHDDARAKFLHLHASDVILTSVVHDHINVYPTMEDYEKPFKELLTSLPEDGLVVASKQEPNALALAQASGRTVVSYGAEGADFFAKDITYGDVTRFTLVREGEAVCEIQTTLLGAHNVEDIVAACAYALSRGLIPAHVIPAAIESFMGVRRRLDNVAPNSLVPVFEGFGSSYEKAFSAIEAIRLHFPQKRLLVVFEPHTFGWRNRANLSWYDTVFTHAAQVFVAPPASQGAGTHDQLTHAEIIERVTGSGVSAEAYDPAKPEAVSATLAADDVVLILTSGDLEGSLPSLVSSLAGRFPK